MRPQGHLAAGILVGSLMRRRLDVSPAAAMAGGALAANLPDGDVAVAWALNKLYGTRIDFSLHHTWATHRPAAWAAAAAALYAAGLRRTGELVAAGTLAHLAQDSVSDAIAWAWPLSSRRAGLQLDPGTMPAKQWLRAYRGTPAHRAEQAIIAAALITIAVAAHQRLA